MAQSFLAFGLFRLLWKVQDKAAYRGGNAAVYACAPPKMAAAYVGTAHFFGASF
jgi:hypothetical protein